MTLKNALNRISTPQRIAAGAVLVIALGAVAGLLLARQTQGAPVAVATPTATPSPSPTPSPTPGRQLLPLRPRLPTRMSST